MNKIDKQLESIIEHETSCVENARDVSDEFAVMPCTCGADKKISQIKQSILKAIMELHKRKCGEEGFELGYLRLEDLINLLSEAKKK